MLKLKLNLHQNRLGSSSRRRISTSPEHSLPIIEELKGLRHGSKISRLFRHVFEHKSIKRVLGTNLALMLMLGSFVPTNVSPTEAEEVIIREADVPLTTQKTIQLPTEDKTRITQGFTLFHPGADFAMPIGTDLYPIKDGVVEAISYSRYAYGNAVIVNHGDKVTSLYAHLSKIAVVEGQEVTTLTKLGDSGSTGRSTGPHLHLEVRRNGLPINPFIILPSPVSPIY